MKLKTLVLCLGVLLFSSAFAKTIEVDIHGFTCAFCVDSLQRKLKQLPDTIKVDVSLKTKKVRIVTSNDKPDFELIKQTVIDAGFTPVKIRTVEDEH